MILFITNPYPVIQRYSEEKYYNDLRSQEKIEFPSIEEQSSINLSVVVPAYNEEERCKINVLS